MTRHLPVLTCWWLVGPAVGCDSPIGEDPPLDLECRIIESPTRDEDQPCSDLGQRFDDSAELRPGSPIHWDTDPNWSALWLDSPIMCRLIEADAPPASSARPAGTLEVWSHWRTDLLDEAGAPSRDDFGWRRLQVGCSYEGALPWMFRVFRAMAGTWVEHGSGEVDRGSLDDYIRVYQFNARLEVCAGDPDTGRTAHWAVDLRACYSDDPGCSGVPDLTLDLSVPKSDYQPFCAE